jgi:hypothetical protein
MRLRLVGRSLDLKRNFMPKNDTALLLAAWIGDIEVTSDHRRHRSSFLHELLPTRIRGILNGNTMTENTGLKNETQVPYSRVQS